MNIEIANRLVNMRKSNNLSQEALAEKLGISRQAVSKWERAEASPDTDNLILLARLYGVSLDELLQTEDEIPVPEENRNEYRTTEFQSETTQYDSSNQQKWKMDEDSPEASTANLLTLIVTIAIVITYMLIGCVWGAWHPGWLLFLVIPIWHSVVECITRHSIKHFAYPVVAAFLYLALGFFMGMWHPGWVIFITIPLFYAVVNYIDAMKRRNKTAGNTFRGEESTDEE